MITYTSLVKRIVLYIHYEKFLFNDEHNFGQVNFLFPANKILLYVSTSDVEPEIPSLETRVFREFWIPEYQDFCIWDLKILNINKLFVILTTRRSLMENIQFGKFRDIF